MSSIETGPEDVGPVASQDRFFFNVNFVFLSTIANYGVSFLAFVLIARELGPEGRGITALFQAGVNLGFAFLSLGVPQAAIYYISRREIGRRQVMEAGAVVSVFATVVTALGVLVIYVFFHDKVGGDDLPYWLAVLAMPLVLQAYQIEGVLRGEGRFGATNALDVFIPLVTFLGLLGAEIAVGLTVENTVYTWTLTFIPAILLGYWLIGRSAWPMGLPSRAVLSQTIRFGLQSQLSNLIQLLNYRLDAYLVLILVNTAGVGLYSVGVSLSEGMWFIANSVAIVLLTNLTAGDEEYAARMTPLVCRNTLLVTALTSLPVAALAPTVVPLMFGSQYDDAVLPFIILLPGAVALAGTKVLAAYVFSRGRPMINAWISFATLIVTVGADLVLIPLFEVSGAAAGSSIAYGMSLTLTAVAYRRLSGGGSIAAALIPRPSDAGLYINGVRSILRRVTARRATA